MEDDNMRVGAMVALITTVFFSASAYADNACDQKYEKILKGIEESGLEDGHKKYALMKELSEAYRKCISGAVDGEKAMDHTALDAFDEEVFNRDDRN
jgi:hypothetical protein